MDMNSKSIEGLSELFIKEPFSLEVVLMITDEGPKTIKDISGIRNGYDMTDMKDMKDILDKLRKFSMVDIKDDIVDITDYGKGIIEKLRRHTNEVKNMEDISNKGNFDDIDFSKLDIGGIIRLCLKCKTKEDAEKVMRQYEKYCDTPEIARIDLGYIFGYCDSEDREKLYVLFPVNHPIFGEKFGRG